MKKQNLRLLWSVFFCALALCGLTFYMLIAQINKESQLMIRDVGEIYMDEMSTQLQNHFKTIIELRLDMVKGIIQRNPPESFSGYSQEMVEQLIMNGQTRNFDFLALYSMEGDMKILYGNPIEIMGEQAFLNSLNSDDDKLARARDTVGNELLLMGISTVYPMENGKKCTALIAGIDLDYIDYAMALDGDKSLCYDHIINSKGDFIVRTGNNDYIDEDNYFAYLLTCEGVDKPIGQVVEEMKEAIAGNTEYSASVMVQDGQQRQIYCVPLSHSEWYLVCVMSHGKLDDVVQSRTYYRMFLSVGAAMIVMLLMLTIFLMYYRMSIKQIKLLTEARIAADEASRAKSRFLSNMSHDIRTPMNAIMGMTSVALANVDKPEQLKNYLNKILVASRHLLGLINDILDMSKIESGKMVLNRDIVSLREVMDNIVSVVQPQIKEKNQSFDIYLRDIRTEQVYFDSVRLNQVLLNLFSNAMKFTPERGSISMLVTQEDSPKGEKYVRTNFWVKDTGIGMTKKFQEKMFESFTREDDLRIHKIEGTGLGMAITKHIIDTAGGKIEVKSELNKGTEFHVILDMEQVEVQETDMMLPNWDVLVVDDDEMLCRSTVDILKEIGLHVEWASDGPTAIEMAEKRHMESKDYHIILLDWKMPVMDGIETARQLHSRIGEKVPLLLISAYDWGDIESEARAAGIQGFLTKPLFKSTLFYGLVRYDDSKAELFKAPEKSVDDFTGYRLLVAEDSEVNWEVVNELLSDIGFSLEWAENGKACVEMFQEALPGYYDAILMDMRMPIMNGVEATKEIRALEREDAKEIPIIAMTADAFDEDINRCLECGMNAHVAKPLVVSKLLKVLRKYMKLHI